MRFFGRIRIGTDSECQGEDRYSGQPGVLRPLPYPEANFWLQSESLNTMTGSVLLDAPSSSARNGRPS